MRREETAEVKKYVKPELIFESFTLTQQITVACAWDFVNSQDKVNCYAKPNEDFGMPPGGNLFINGNCTLLDAVEGEMYCITDSGENLAVFNS